MDTIMELDDLKQAWQTLDRRLELQNNINLQLFKDRKLEKARSSLHPLFWDQIVQLLFGLGFILLAAMLWSTRPDVAHMIAAGVVVHAYGVATLIVAGITLGTIRRIDYAAPVLQIQKQLARVRKLYIRSGMIAGLPWWFLWVPILMLLSALVGVDMYARAPSMVWIGLGIGLCGLLATWWFHRWSHHPARAAFGKRLDDGAAGGSILRMQAILDEIAQFEKE
jgi:hypothetical protein